MNKNLLKQYARLVAGVGINVQKGQTVVVRCRWTVRTLGGRSARPALSLARKTL